MNMLKEIKKGNIDDIAEIIFSYINPYKIQFNKVLIELEYNDIFYCSHCYNLFYKVKKPGFFIEICDCCKSFCYCCFKYHICQTEKTRKYRLTRYSLNDEILENLRKKSFC